jgi:putative acetyltransferase
MITMDAPEAPLIREAQMGDLAAIQDLHRASFGSGEGESIAALVGELWLDPANAAGLSLVAEQQGQPVGHLQLSPVQLSGREGAPAAQILAPFAVHPALQGRGIGRRLVEESVRRMKQRSTDLVFVLGDPALYTRFGFRCALDLRLEAPHPIPEAYRQAWMVINLSGVDLPATGYRVQCCAALNDPRHWL